MIKSTRNEDENCRIVHNAGFNSTCCHFNILCQQAVYEYLDCQGKVTGVTGKLFSEHLSVDSKYSPRKEKTSISCFKKCASYSSNTLAYAIVVSPLVTLCSNYIMIAISPGISNETEKGGSCPLFTCII